MSRAAREREEARQKSELFAATYAACIVANKLVEENLQPSDFLPWVTPAAGSGGHRGPVPLDEFRRQMAEEALEVQALNARWAAKWAREAADAEAAEADRISATDSATP